MYFSSRLFVLFLLVCCCCTKFLICKIIRDKPHRKLCVYICNIYESNSSPTKCGNFPNKNISHHTWLLFTGSWRHGEEVEGGGGHTYMYICLNKYIHQFRLTLVATVNCHLSTITLTFERSGLWNVKIKKKQNRFPIKSDFKCHGMAIP